MQQYKGVHWLNSLWIIGYNVFYDSPLSTSGEIYCFPRRQL